METAPIMSPDIHAQTLIAAETWNPHTYCTHAQCLSFFVCKIHNHLFRILKHISSLRHASQHYQPSHTAHTSTLRRVCSLEREKQRQQLRCVSGRLLHSSADGVCKSLSSTFRSFPLFFFLPQPCSLTACAHSYGACPRSWRQHNFVIQESFVTTTGSLLLR